jgi:integrase/recombinase XerD
MTPLRKRMIEDLQLHGFAPATQRAYLHAVHMLAAHYDKSPALLTEEELRAYSSGRADAEPLSMTL